jgi:hypothetical protein
MVYAFVKCEGNLNPKKVKDMFDPSLYYPTLNAPYKSWNDKEMVTGSHYIFTCMNLNEHFTTLAAEVTSYGELSTQFANLVSLATNRDKNAVTAKDMGRLALIEASINLGNSVTQVANGDFLALASSGIEMRTRPQSVVLGTTSNPVLTVDSNVVGQLKVKVPTVDGAKGYIVKYTINPQTTDTQWVNVFGTTSQRFIDGLQSGAKYWVMVGAVGGKGQTAWSGAVLSPFVP